MEFCPFIQLRGKPLKTAEALLKDTKNYPFIGEVIDQLDIGRSAFCRYFPPDRIKELRGEHKIP